MSEPTFRPRLNHVAISMAPAVLDERGREEILEFYGDVFGWTEGDNTGESGQPTDPTEVQLHADQRVRRVRAAADGRDPTSQPRPVARVTSALELGTKARNGDRVGRLGGSAQ
jgi:hypothetical protein